VNPVHLGITLVLELGSSEPETQPYPLPLSVHLALGILDSG